MTKEEAQEFERIRIRAIKMQESITITIPQQVTGGETIIIILKLIL